MTEHLQIHEQTDDDQTPVANFPLIFKADGLSLLYVILNANTKNKTIVILFETF